MRNIQKYLYYLLFFLTPLVMFSGTSELFEFNKMILIYLLTVSILTVWIIRSIQVGKILFKRTIFDLFIILFFVSQLLSTIFSIDIHTSIFGYYGRFNGGLLSIISYLILYYSFAEFLFFDKEEGKNFLQNILLVSLISSTIVILWGLPGRFGKDLSCLVFSGQLNNACWTAQFDPAARMFSTLGQPNWMGAYLSIVFFYGFYYFIKTPLFSKKSFFYAAYIILNLLAVFFTNSRSSLFTLFGLLFFTVCIYLFLFRNTYYKNTRFKIMFIGLFSIFFLLLFKTGYGRVDHYLTLSTYFPEKKEVTKVTKETSLSMQSQPLHITESIDIRKIVWKGAYDLGFQYPLFGTGVETFAYAYYFVRPIEHNLTSEWDYLYNKAHNEYLNFFATTGFFGTISYLLFIFSVLIFGFYWIFKTQTKKDHNSFLQLIFLFSWISILITNFFGFSTTTINLYFFTIPLFMYFIFKMYKKDNTDNSPVVLPIKENKDEGNKKIGYVIVALFYIFSIQYIITYWIADQKFALGENYAKANDYQNAVSQIARAYELKKEHVYKDKLSYYLANVAFIAAYQKNNILANDLIQKADRYNKETLQESPENILYWKTTIKNQYLFYQITNDPQYLKNGIKALEKAKAISPTDTKIPYFFATYLSLLYDEEKDPTKKIIYQKQALQAIDTSIQLKRDYYESYYLKAQLQKKYKMFTEAKQTYQYILDHISPNNKQIQQEMGAI